MPEFGWKATTSSRLYGITRNPLDLSLTPGGSSGGSAAAVLCGMGLASLGTDVGGSVRIPAAICGLFGFKPSCRIVPSLSASNMGNIGPITRSVEDAAHIMDVIAKPHELDALSVKTFQLMKKSNKSFEFVKNLKRGQLKGLKVAFSCDLGFKDMKVDKSIKEVRLFFLYWQFVK